MFVVKTGHLTHLILIPRIIQLGCSAAAGVSSEVQKHRTSEASPEQLLGHDQSINSAVNHWSERLLLVVHSHSGHTEHCFC